MKARHKKIHKLSIVGFVIHIPLFRASFFLCLRSPKDGYSTSDDLSCYYYKTIVLFVLAGMVGCLYCGGLGHRIADCPKLEAIQNKQANSIGRRDYLAHSSADYWAEGTGSRGEYIAWILLHCEFAVRVYKRNDRCALYTFENHKTMEWNYVVFPVVMSLRAIVVPCTNHWQLKCGSAGRHCDTDIAVYAPYGQTPLRTIYGRRLWTLDTCSCLCFPPIICLFNNYEW